MNLGLSSLIYGVLR